MLYAVVRFFPDLPGVIATKLPAMIADFVIAWFALRIVRLKHPDSPFPVFAALAVLFAPTVVLNSAFWGQADALYASALIASIYFLMVKKHALAMLLFGMSFSLKARAIFLSPLLFALFLRKEIPWKLYLLIPLVALLALVPAWIAGRPLPSLLLIYPEQAGQYQQLSMHAPSLYAWIPNSGRLYAYFYPAGLVLAATTGLTYSILVSKSRAEISPAILLQLSLVSVMLRPFVLPKMLDRYFYLADVLSIIYVFCFPRDFFAPVLMSLVSFFSYQPTLFGVEPVPITLLAAVVLGLLSVLARNTLMNLFPVEPEPETPKTH